MSKPRRRLTDKPELVQSLETVLLQAQFESCFDGLLVVGEDGKAVLYNDRFGKMWGIPKELLDDRKDELMIAFVVDQLEHPHSFVSKVKYLYSHPLEKSHDILEFKDGRIFDRHSYPLVDRNGGYQGRIWSFRDITEVAKIEEGLRQYAQIVSSSSDLLALLDTQFVYQVVNQAYVDAFDKTAEELIGHSVPELFGKEFFEEVIKPHAIRCLAGEKINYQEWFDFPGYNQKRFMDFSYFPYFGEGGKVVSFVVCGRDVTERKKAEETLQTVQKLESLGTLAGGIAHDFNNILTGILGNLALAGREVKPGSELGELLAESQKACEAAKGLTHQLLTFSAGGKPVTQVRELGPIIREACTFAARGSNTRCIFEIADELYSAKVDKNQLSQVLQNLVLNATESMQEGGSVTVKAANIHGGGGAFRFMPHGQYVRISIKDEGEGIVRSRLAKIFDPYFSTKENGRGLGLATCHSIIQNHGGHMEVESEPGVGTTFSFILPAAGVIEGRAPLSIKEEPENIKSGTGRLLVMDDEPIVARALSRILTSLGYYCETSPEGAQALELCASAQRLGKNFDVVIMDLTIPGGMGGLEMAKQLKGLDPTCKAIVSSGYSNNPIMSEYTKYGFSGVLCKPYTIEDVSEVVSRILGS